MDKITVGLVSLGCPKNQMDAELMLAKLRDAGYGITADANEADVVVINTCGFIEDAKQEAIDTILEFAELKTAGVIRGIVVTGCLAQRYGADVARELPECDVVLGLGANGDIVEAVRRAYEGDGYTATPSLASWPLDGDRILTTPPHYAYLRIADGCDNRCTYCAIPLIRGGLRSRAREDILAEAEALAADGVKELIVVAQDPTVYGEDRYGRAVLPELLTDLCAVDGIRWIRLLYCYPEHITDALLDVMAREDKIVKYLDLPIQHVNGEVLAAMNRHGDRDSLTALLKHIREMVPGIVLRTTVLVGFPGESEAAFEELCDVLHEVPFERLGCFAFSPEDGTPAATLPNQIDDDVKAHRRDVVMALQTRLADAWNDTRVGQEMTVLVDGFDDDVGLWRGRSAADAPEIDPAVYIATEDPVAAGEFITVRITDRLDWDLLGER